VSSKEKFIKDGVNHGVKLHLNPGGEYDTLSESHTFRLLNKEVRPIYMVPTDPLAEEVLIPAFRIAERVDCMVGFFSSEILASLAPGLATFITSSDNSFRLVISPFLRSEDQVALEKGLRSSDDVAGRILDELIVTKDSLQRFTLRCLTWLLLKKRIEIKVALMRDALFHPKVWLFEQTNDVIAAHGSGNATFGGISKNIEQIVISRSWQDSVQRFITDKLCSEFRRYWNNEDKNCIVIPIPTAIEKRLIRTYGSGREPTEDELRTIYARAKTMKKVSQTFESVNFPIGKFKIPSWLRYEDGPFEHQGRAKDAWCDAQYRGVLEMATGSGKTITAMVAAYHLYVEQKALLIVVAAPYLPLIAQWCEEIMSFGISPINLSALGNSAARLKELQKLRRRIRAGLSVVELVVVSHDILCSKEFKETIMSFDCARLLIADEVHNLGRRSFIEEPPDFFEYRLGLSATPIRQYDEDGTESLFEFFGPIVFRFTLAEAIGHCLVEYDYFVHAVYLSDEEMAEWYDLTGKIHENMWRREADSSDEYLTKLFRDRRALLETASGKISMLETLLQKEDFRNLDYALVYTTDKSPEQLNEVNRLLRNNNILFHQLTASETTNRDLTKQIIKSFQERDIQVLSAKRVLDEGVNIPQISKAFILASTTVERQWVQRRGRLLRKCSAIGKTHSVIHDLLALPPKMNDDLDLDARKLVQSELRRVQKFAELARNSGSPNGPLAMIDRMVDAAYR